ncbi:hypothetical protein GOBAR_DD20352 [Gossypium barbadense]|nr:hypothetical protein GOBAR_DD20352 [Gossypium barbadense]
MYLRKAAVNLLRRVRLPSHSIFTSVSPPTTSMAIATPLPFSLSRKIQFPNQFGNGSSWSTTYADPPIWTILSIQAACICGIGMLMRVWRKVSFLKPREDLAALEKDYEGSGLGIW